MGKVAVTLKSVTKNKIFVPLFFAYLVATIGLSLNSAIAIFYYKYRLKLTEREIKYVIGLFILVISFSIAGWVFVSRKYGKKWPAFFGILALGLMTVICYPLFPVQKLYPTVLDVRDNTENSRTIPRGHPQVFCLEGKSRFQVVIVEKFSQMFE